MSDSDTDERARQIRERHQYNKLWCKQNHMRTPGYSDDIDYLLSLLDSHTAEVERLRNELNQHLPKCSRGAVVGDSIGVKP